MCIVNHTILYMVFEKQNGNLLNKFGELEMSLLVEMRVVLSWTQVRL